MNNKYDNLTFSQRPASLDAAYEREAILSGLVSRVDACFPENRPEPGWLDAAFSIERK
jgi:hypothetical protein